MIACLHIGRVDDSDGSVTPKLGFSSTWNQNPSEKLADCMFWASKARKPVFWVPNASLVG